MAEATDLLVIGGGVMGLWAALRAGEVGLSVTLVDAGAVGGGASGGLMGALFPWMPDRWCAKKQYQFDALVALPGEIARLEAATGLSANYRRVGRVVPLPAPHLRPIAARHQADAEANWRHGDERFHWHLRDGAPDAPGVAAGACAAGHVFDTLAARVEPRGLVALLRASLARLPRVRIIEHAALASLEPAPGRAEIARHGAADAVRFSHAIVAAGVASFPILEGLLPPLPKPLGQGVKGQAALLKADIDPQSPVVFLDGLYCVAHEGGRIAIGSTSENRFGDPFATDGQLDDVVARARALIPALRDAPVVERWAGLRPKSVGRDPLVGALPDHPSVVALTGGFKISFGVAHRLADSALDIVIGSAKSPLPRGFTLEGQLAALS